MEINETSELSDLLTHCIHCGFCLEACPTFQLTGAEEESPRGRIYQVGAAIRGELTWKEIKPQISHCVACLGCETACPSGVEYGRIVELARHHLDQDEPKFAHHKLVDFVTSGTPYTLAAKFGPHGRAPFPIAAAISDEPQQANLPRPQKQTLPLVAPLTDALPVYMLEGCAMKGLFQRVHAATRNVLARAGYRVETVEQGCCGSMHAHLGFMEDAASRARDLVNAFNASIPIVLNSAGCGSTMKRYGELLGASKGVKQFTDRVKDLSEFLEAIDFAKVLQSSPGLAGLKVTYHDACHLAHGQRITAAPRNLIQAVPGIEYVELEDADLCCGSAGIYNVLEPTFARGLLDKKMETILATNADVVVMGNPGCHAWIEQGAQEHGRKVRVVHLAEYLEASFVGLDAFPAP